MRISLKQLRPLACHTRTHCETCRTDGEWRKRVTGIKEFECPHGITKESIENSYSKTYREEVINDNISAKECEHCEDIDVERYYLKLNGVNIFTDCFNMYFDINGDKSIRFDFRESIDGNYELNQQKSPCLWMAELPNFLIKYYNKKDNCIQSEEKIDLIDVNIYLEKISKTKWHFSITANGGFDLFSSIIISDEGKCLNNIEISNKISKNSPFEDVGSILADLYENDSVLMGKSIGYGGTASISCKKIK